MNNQDIEQQYADFEAWASKYKSNPQKYDQIPAWLAYQAALQSQEVQALRKDAERLDWLQQNDGRFFSLLHITSIVGKGFSPANSNKWFLSLRDAIDAAMEKQK